MNPKLIQAFEELSLAIDSTSTERIDRALMSITQENDPRSVASLLLLLNDGFQFDEGMFSIIHTAEMFDDKNYVDGFIMAIPRLFKSSPRMASIVLIRMLNNDVTSEILVNFLAKANYCVKISVRALCASINEDDPDFLCKSHALLVVTNS